MEKDNKKKKEISSSESCNEENSINFYKKPEKKTGFNKNNALITVVAVLVIISGIQVFQTQKLLDAVSNGTIKANTQTQGNLIGLPSQVGGCG